MRDRLLTQTGFSLLETLVALLVFSVMTIGIVPVIAASLKGSTISRSYTAGKNVGVQAMERARGLPYFVSYLAQNKRVDVLDLYYPNYVASGTFVTTCVRGSTNPACPRSIPAGTTIRYSAAFVRPTDGTTPQTFTTVVAPVAYRWDSAIGADTPPASLMTLRVTTEWAEAGRTRTIDLSSIVGNKRFDLVGTGDASQPSPAGTTAPPPAAVAPENIKVRATADQEYTIQVVTGFRDSSSRRTELSSLAGASTSFIELGTQAVARQATRSGQARLVALPATDTDWATDLITLDMAQHVRQAPPSTGWLFSSVAKKTVRHPNISLDIAHFGDTYTEGYTNTPSTALPDTYAIFESDTNDKSVVEYWVHNQAASGTNLRLSTTRGWMVEATERDAKNAGYDDMWGGSQANTTALTATNRRAEAVARAEIWNVKILPTTFAADGVVWIQNLLARTQCTSTANFTSAVASATLSGTLRYWRDTTNDGVLNGSYASVTISGTAGTDPLAAIRDANPLVYDGTTASTDVYLFDDPAAGRAGYLLRWSSLASLPTFKDASGRVTSADIDTAIRIDTVATNSSVPESNLSISVANLTCKAEDYR